MPRVWDRFSQAEAIAGSASVKVPRPASPAELFMSSMDATRASAAPTKARIQRFASPYVFERGEMLEKATGIPAWEWRGDIVEGPWSGDDLLPGLGARRQRMLGHIRAGEISLGADGAVRASLPEAISALEGNEDYAKRLIAFDAALKADPMIPSDEKIYRLISEDILRIRRDYAGLSAASPGFAAGLAEFAGGMAGGLVNVLQTEGGPAMLAAGGFARVGGATLAARFAQRAGIEGLVGGATELPVQAQAFDFNQRLKVPYTMKEAAANVVFATLGSAVLGGTFQTGADLLRPLNFNIDLREFAPSARSKLRKLVEIYDKAKAENPAVVTPESEAAVAVLRETLEISDAAPVALNASQERAHAAVAAKAREDLEAGDTPKIERQVAALQESLPELPVVDRDLPSRRRLTRENLETFDPAALEVDAALFQFKAGGDEFGVNARLRDLSTFEPTQAGTVLTWESKAGKLFIVDGHQRMGIARRALAGGQDPAGVFLTGYRLREVDGYTPQHARVEAAFKNIGEGTGSAVDVAKIYREAHRDLIHSMPQLSGNNALARDGRNLSKLGDEAFGMVVNDVVSPEHGAIVGEILDDAGEQVAAIDVLRRSEPASQAEARAIVEQVRAAGFTRDAERSQGGLFGEEEFATSLFKERAQILTAAKAEVRRDLATFRTLTKQEGRIGAAGNKLAKRQNLAKVEEDEQTLVEIDRLANTAGPVSDALGAAARSLADGELGRQEATAAFVGALRSAADGARSRGARAGARKPSATEKNLIERGGKFFDANGVGRAAPGVLTPEQRLVEDRIAAIVKDVDAAEKAYALLEDSKGGRLLSADTARELSEDYLKNRALSVAVHEPVSWLMKQLFARALAREIAPEHVQVAMFTAGGAGAGKTTAIDTIRGVKEQADKAHVIYDANMNTVPSAVSKINAALAAGFDVRIALIVREPVDALVNGALKRARRQEGEYESGRTLPYFDYIDTHTGAIETFPQLREIYKNDPRVKFLAIDNRHGKNNAREFNDLDEVNAINYNDRGPAVRAALEQEHDSGRISKAIYEGFLARDDPRHASADSGVRPEARPIPGAEPEPAGGAGRLEGQQEVTYPLAPPGARYTELPPGEPAGRADLLGDDTRTAQALADETAARDAARNAGQVDLETGDPTDIFSAARKNGDLFTPATAQRAVAQAQDLVLEDPERLFTIIDETGVERRIPAAQAFADLDAEEAALKRVALCATPGEG